MINVKKYYYIALAVLTLLLPDILLRGLVGTTVFSGVYVETVSWLFTFFWVFLILFVCVFMLPKRIGRAVYLTAASAFMVLAICQYVYFDIFDQFFWIKSIVLAGEGARYIGYAVKHLDAKLVVCVAIWAVALVFAAVKWVRPPQKSKRWLLLALVPVAGLCGMHIYMQPELHDDSMDTWDSWNKPRVVYERFNDVNKGFEVTGFYQFTMYDICRTVFVREDYDRDGFERVEAYFAQKGEAVPNDYTGMFKGKNVIAVMMESVDTWMIDETYTPTLHRMMQNGIHFTNYNAPFFGVGFTLSSEFAFNTGHFTPVSAASASNFSKNAFPYSLARLFAEEGYAVHSFHFNNSEFYNRGIMHKNYGYEKYHSFADFGISDADAQLDSNMFLNDGIYSKMTEKKPFFNFVITYSAHLPYNKEDAKLTLAKGKYPHLIDPMMHPEQNNAMILAADTDEFFRLLLERLEADGLLKDTVIVAYTDHYAYGVSDAALLSACKGEGLVYRVPAFIYSPGMQGKQIAKPMMTIDWLPTLVNLFDLKRGGKYIGNDILDPGNPGFAYFETYAWLDEKMYYDPASEEHAAANEASVYIQKQNQRVRDSMEISDIMILGDYYKER